MGLGAIGEGNALLGGQVAVGVIAIAEAAVGALGLRQAVQVIVEEALGSGVDIVGEASEVTRRVKLVAEVLDTA
jgi:hypothetical protein